MEHSLALLRPMLPGAADVAVNRRTGEVTVTRVTVGHDAGLMVNPAGVRHQVHGNVVQTTSRALMEQVQFDERALVTSKEWGAYPIITFRDVPEVDVLMMARPEQPPLGVGESASVPGAAAIANAIFDATGVRFRSAPFTRDVILAGLGAAQAAPRKRRRWAGAAAVLTAALGSFAVWHAALPRATPPGADVFSPALIERGRLLAAAGDCAVCHGANLAGGRGIHTPFGTVYATNITPDEATGIGNYSFPAFQRAMRNGVARDGRNLYPAFPYTAFAHMTDADLLAVYAFVMAQPPVHAAAPVARLAFPFNLRPLMAGWNLLFHRPAPLTPDPARTAQWNRGAYLVQAVAHCGACHTPRKRARSGAAGFCLGRRPGGRLGCTIADRSVGGASGMDAAGRLRLPPHRPLGGARRGCRADGSRGQPVGGPARRGHCSDGGVYRGRANGKLRPSQSARGRIVAGSRGRRLGRGTPVRRRLPVVSP